jgi:hypothetical protein
MKKLLHYLLFLSLISICGCSEQKTTPDDQSYFTGYWKLNSAVVADPNALQTVVEFGSEGKFVLNILVAGAAEPHRRWSYNEASQELKLFLPQQEDYLIIEKTRDQFRVKNKLNNAVLIFTRFQ